MEYSYWRITFISCEGNERWTIARSPAHWDEYELRQHITLGGCGDDIAEILSIEESFDEDYCFDYSD